MSNAVFPALPGITFNVKKTPTWNTLVQASASGVETRIGTMLMPKWKFSLPYEFLRSGGTFTELQQLADFYNARNGMLDDFLYIDPDDNAVTAQQFGTGDGSTKTFQLLRMLYSGGFAEIIQNVNGSPSIYISGALQATGYSIGSTGIVTFTSAPASSAPLTWTGSYYFRCRFTTDSTDFEKFMSGLWLNSKLEFTSIPVRS